MIKFLKQKNRKEKGFTLIETLVALSIFLISIVGIMTVLSSGLTDINSAKKKMTATFLAQEGIEYVRNIRDTNVLYSVSGWTNFMGNISDCLTSGGCVIDKDLSMIPCTSICPVMLYDDSQGFNYSVGDSASFIRTIKVVLSGNSEEVNVLSTVSWGTNSSQSVTLMENLFNWVE